MKLSSFFSRALFSLGGLYLGACTPVAQGDVALQSDVEVLQDVRAEDVLIADVQSLDAFSADVLLADVADTFPLDGFGSVSGECDVLDDELVAEDSFFIQNVIDFGDNGYDESEFELLTEGGQEVILDGNAGGSSLLSEVFAYEMLERCESALLLKTETEIAIQDPQGSLTDLLVELDERIIGVSVTRAIAFPFDDPYSVEQARALLDQKLQGVLDSTANVAEEDRWEKQILYVIAYSAEHVAALQSAYADVSPELKSDTVVIVTESRGDDLFLYQN